MVVQEDGSVTVARAVHPAKQSDGIAVIDVEERSIDVSVVHQARAPSSMDVTDESTVTDVGLSNPVITLSRMIIPLVVVEETMNESNVQVALDPPLPG